MSNVQLENGYTRIANELLEVLPKIGLNGTQHNIIWVVFRYTYGFQRKDHELSLTFIAKATNSHKITIQKEITRLIGMNILKEKKAPTFNQSRMIAFNKNINSWQLVKPLTVSELDIVSKIDNHTVSESTNATVSKLTNQERNIKENIKESSTKTFNEQTIEYQLSERLYKNILLNDSKAKKPNLEKWAEFIDKLIRLDGRSIDEIEKVIDFATTDEFWKANILSTKKLRDKFTRLYVKQQSKSMSNNSTSSAKDNSPLNWRGSDKRLC